MIIPLYEQVLMKPIEQENKTKSGIITWVDNEKETLKSEIVALWPEAEKRGMKTWDIALHDKHVPHKLDIDWEKYLLIQWKEIKALYSKKK